MPASELVAADVAALVDAARQARGHALASYSGFAVGAALRCGDGRVFSGCNIENASYGLTMCAERVALFKALSEGARSFTAIAVVTGAETPTPPCGACRQLLWEFCANIHVVLAGVGGVRAEHDLAALLPAPFDGGSLRR
ncbi:MAG: cytidine deaminase [Vicinamibacterales bacterium]